MIISFMAWVLRFGFFAIGGPEGFPVVFLVLSMIVYGMAFDFFNVSGSLFIADEAPDSIKSQCSGYLHDDDEWTGLYRGRLRSWVGYRLS